MALPRGAMGLPSVCDCAGYFLMILTIFDKNLEPDLDLNCSSLYPVSNYYFRNQATGGWPVMGCWLDIAVIWL